MQFDLVDGAGVVFEAAHDGRIDDESGLRHSRLPQQASLICVKFGDDLLGPRISFDYRCNIRDRHLRSIPLALRPGRSFAPVKLITRDIPSALETGALGEVAASSLRPSHRRASCLQRPRCRSRRACRSRAARSAVAGISSPPSPMRLHHPIEHLAVIDLHHISAARNAERFHRVRRHHAHLGIGRGRRASPPCRRRTA